MIVKIGLIQMRMSADRGTCLRKAKGLIDEAAEKGAQIVCLPELFNSRYFPQEHRSRMIPERVPGRTTSMLSAAAKRNSVVLVGGSIYEKTRRGCYNTSVVFNEVGEIIGRYRKVHLPNDPGFYEQAYFSSGTRFHVFETRYGIIGVLICFDQWYPEAARVIKLLGADIVFYPTAIGWVKGVEPTEGNWQKAWENVQRGHAISNSIVVAAVNRVGREKDIHFWGGSFLFDQFGKTLIRADDREGVFLASCDFSRAKSIEEGWGFLRNRRPSTYSKLVE